MSKVIKQEILALIEQLSQEEQSEFNMLMLAGELREEYTELLQTKLEGSTEEIDTLDRKLEAMEKKQKALTQLIELNKQYKAIYDGLTEEQKKEFQARGYGTRKLMQSKKRKEHENIVAENNRLDRQTAS